MDDTSSPSSCLSCGETISAGEDRTRLELSFMNGASLSIRSALVVGIVPSLLVALLFYSFLGHRRDYLGHYAAGYGGTLTALAVVLAAVPWSRFERLAARAVIPVTILCIAAGTVTEATVFRLAKFDEVDYCNQNLGAVVAGLVALHLCRASKPTDATLRSMIAIGVVFLLIGVYFALS